VGYEACTQFDGEPGGSEKPQLYLRKVLNNAIAASTKTVLNGGNDPDDLAEILLQVHVSHTTALIVSECEFECRTNSSLCTAL
jgi:hypothetical protein